MRKYYAPIDLRNADVSAVEQYGIPSLMLMENAGMNAAHELMCAYPESARIVIFAGSGNNGGDGFVAARYLIQSNKTVHVITSAEIEKYSGDALANLKALLDLRSVDCHVLCSKGIDDTEIISLAEKCDVLVDALLGTGTSGAPRGEAARLISLCQNAGTVLALDIPSGIDPASGDIFDPCVKADMTVTFLAAKTGMCVSPAREMCGSIVEAGIGIASDIVLHDAECISSYKREDLPLLLPPIRRDIHKGDRGGVLIFGGSWNYRGAPLLAALGALRSGAGLVVLAVPDFIIDAASAMLPEAIFVPLKTIDGDVSPDFFEGAVSPWMGKCRAAVFGPGIGRSDSMKSITRWFLTNWKGPLLLDADALFFLSELRDELCKRADTVITPHSGEAATILKNTPAVVNADRISSCRRLTAYAAVAVLKGMNTIVASDIETRVILEGSPVLAVPGSGDVLSGSIGAMLASGMPPIDAAAAAVLAHAAAGSNLEKSKGLRGTTAREIADELPFIFR